MYCIRMLHSYPLLVNIESLTLGILIYQRNYITFNNEPLQFLCSTDETNYK